MDSAEKLTGLLDKVDELLWGFVNPSFNPCPWAGAGALFWHEAKFQRFSAWMGDQTSEHFKSNEATSLIISPLEYFDIGND